MTPEQYLKLPEEKPYLEYVDGMVVQKPMFAKQEGILCAAASSHILAWTRQYGGETGIMARHAAGDGPSYRIPDVSFWKPGYDGADDDPPTLAVEIRSPGQSIAELRTKCRFFRANGVEACWIIDPETRTAEVFEGGHEAEPVAQDGSLAAACMPGFVLGLAELFSVLDA